MSATSASSKVVLLWNCRLLIWRMMPSCGHAAFAEHFRALHQLNHNHDCTSTCIKYVKQKAKDTAQDALRLGKVVACRFLFFHTVVLNAATSLVGHACAEQPAEKGAPTAAEARRIRRRGKRVVSEPYLACTNEHNEFCRAIVQRAKPFRSATTDAGQVWGRCDIDFQFF